LEIAEKLQNAFGIAMIHNNLGNLYINKGEFRKAEGHYREVFKAHEEGLFTNDTLLGVTLSNIAFA